MAAVALEDGAAGDAEAERIGVVGQVRGDPGVVDGQIVVVDEQQDLAARGAHALVAGARAAEGRKVEQAHARVGGALGDARGVGGRRVDGLVDDDDLEARVGALGEQAIEELAQRGQPVVGAHDHRRARRSAHPVRLRVNTFQLWIAIAIACETKIRNA
jgi:hypothetical protein